MVGIFLKLGRKCLWNESFKTHSQQHISAKETSILQVIEEKKNRKCEIKCCKTWLYPKKEEAHPFYALLFRALIVVIDGFKSWSSMVRWQMKDRAQATSMTWRFSSTWSQTNGWSMKNCKFARRLQCDSLRKIPFIFLLQIPANHCIAPRMCSRRRTRARLPHTVEGILRNSSHSPSIMNLNWSSAFLWGEFIWTHP